MTNMQEKNNPIFRFFIISIEMILVIISFIFVLVALRDLGSIIQITLVILLLFLFCYLGAKLLVTMSQMYDKSYSLNIKNDDLKIHEVKIISAKELCDNLVNDGFFIEKIPDLLDQEIYHLQKVNKNRGAYIDEFFIVNKPISSTQFEEIDKIIIYISRESLKEINTTIIRQRCIFLCIFCEKMSEKEIRNFVSKFNYTFSILLPVVVDIQAKKIYHYDIPINKRFAKGKALVNAQQIVFKYLYKW